MDDTSDYFNDEHLSQHAVILVQLGERTENCSILMRARREKWSGAGTSCAGCATKGYTLSNYALQIKCSAFMPFLFCRP